MKNFLLRIYGILKSPRFFTAVIIFFVFEAAWIALSAVYPMAFDENFHFGIIKVYSHYWLPFLTSQPPHANAFGAVARDPSYLYHYLMSFPYRVIQIFVHTQTMQVICLRFINIALFCVGLILFRNVLLKARLSKAFTNVSLLLFVLIPVTPQLAAQINYDNMVFPLVAWICLLTFKVTDEIRSRQPNIKTIITLGIVGTLGSLVKYAFMPIFISALLFLAYVAIRRYKGKYKQFFTGLWKSWLAQSKKAKLVLVILLVIASGMFIQRDGYNLVKYHSFTADCSQVLSIKQCSAYGPWNSSYERHQAVINKVGKVDYDNPLTYMLQWVYWLGYRLFFAINGISSNYTNYPPLPLPIVAAYVLLFTGLVAMFIWRRRIFKDNLYLAFFFVASILYMASLWIDGFAQYHYTDTLVAMNGRYLLPVLLLIAALVGRSFSIWMGKSLILKSALTLIVIILFMEGGGFLTFITRSDSSWYWPNSTVVRVNDAAKKITKPVILKGSKSYSTSVWLLN